MPSDRVGFVLDLDKGILAVFKNGRQLGVIATGLSGKSYTWAVAMHADQEEVDTGAYPCTLIDRPTEALHVRWAA
jgi:hypothetical protein